ncbi:MAG: hypothetical protein Q7T91_07345 [Sulfuricurvum sp.]|nr:hypothetical protein [Sulfuricurvum sp.]MDP3302317.1 hypothetical protein [Sulfuricurvum sp.]
MDNTQARNVEARRSFLKKAAYVAPAIIALGALNAHADVGAAASVFNGKATVDPGNIHVGDATVTGYSGPDVILGGTYQKVGSSTVVNFSPVEVQQNNFGLFSWAKAFFGNILG